MAALRSHGRVMFGLCFVVILAVGLVADMTLGQTSRKMMNLQGRLTDVDGNPTTGNHLVELGVYDGATGGSRLYYEAQIVTITKGIYNILVGDGYGGFSGTSPANYQVTGGKTGGMDSSVFNRDNIWLEIEIDEDNPLSPRTRIVSSAYAFNADTLDGRDWGAAGAVTATSLTASGAVSAATLSAPTISATTGAATVNASNLVVTTGSANGNITNLNTTTLSFNGGGSINSAKVAQIDNMLSNPGGLVPRGRGTRQGNNYMDHDIYYITGLTKANAGSKFRLTYSDTFYRQTINAVDCYWTMQYRTSPSGGWNTICDYRLDGPDTGRGTSDYTGWWSCNWTGSHSHTSYDSWTRRQPMTAVCQSGTGIAAGTYDFRITSSGGSNCYIDDRGYGQLMVDEVN